MVSDVVGETGRGYIHQDHIDYALEVRFESKCNGEPLKGVRTLQIDCSGYSTNGWERERVKRVRLVGSLLKMSS